MSKENFTVKLSASKHHERGGSDGGWFYSQTFVRNIINSHQARR